MSKDLYEVYACKYNDEYSAFCAYKEAKEIKIKEFAEKWKGKIDDRAYNALMNYTVDIDD